MFGIHYSHGKCTQHDDDVDNGAQLAPCAVCHVHASDTNSNESHVETMPRNGCTTTTVLVSGTVEGCFATR